MCVWRSSPLHGAMQALRRHADLQVPTAWPSEQQRSSSQAARCVTALHKSNMITPAPNTCRAKRSAHMSDATHLSHGSTRRLSAQHGCAAERAACARRVHCAQHRCTSAGLCRTAAGTAEQLCWSCLGRSLCAGEPYLWGSRNRHLRARVAVQAWRVPKVQRDRFLASLPLPFECALATHLHHIARQQASGIELGCHVLRGP